VDQPDPINRLFGYVRLPEFDLIVFASLPFDEVMAPYLEHRIEALLVGAVMSLFLIGIGILVLRNLKASERAEQTARASEAMLQASIEVTGEGFVIFDDQDRLVYLNDRYRNLYSHTAPAMKIGTRFEEIIRYGVERGQYAAAIGHEEEWIAQRLQAHRKSEDQVLQQLGDGTWLKIRERRTPEGYTVGFRIDITEQVEARRAAEQALQDLKQAEKVKTLFLSNISHELRTPLNGIVGMTEVLFHTELNPQQREILKYLKESSEKLRALLMNLLDFSELQTKTLGVEFAPFNPYEMLGALTSKFQTLATGKRLSLKAESQGYVPYSVIGDMARITQVLRQLIENAIKFTAVGEVEVTMFFSAATEEEKPKLGFTVRDTGQGISSDDQVIIFQPFTQKDGSSTREQGGTGIGLSLARGIVEKLGGQLTLKSIPGVGSTFTFNVQVTLPT
jgi:signal transduction histidine kinase